MKLKQTDPAQIEKAWNSLREMRQIRGSDLPPFYFQLANDPQLLEAFKTVFVACNRGEPVSYTHLAMTILIAWMRH